MAHRMANSRSILNADGLATVVGSLPELSPGEHVRLQGNCDNHPKHGPQFKVEVCEQTLPATVAGIEGYLGSGLIKGIGPRFAERIVAAFKEDTFEVIEHTPERLREVPGIGAESMATRTTGTRQKVDSGNQVHTLYWKKDLITLSSLFGLTNILSSMGMEKYPFIEIGFRITSLK